MDPTQIGWRWDSWMSNRIKSCIVAGHNSTKDQPVAHVSFNVGYKGDVFRAGSAGCDVLAHCDCRPLHYYMKAGVDKTDMHGVAY